VADLTVFNRTELTKRLVAKLKREEAVIGGIGNTNFDLFAAGHRPQNFYMLGSMGLAVPIAMGVAMAQPERGVIHEGAGHRPRRRAGCVMLHLARPQRRYRRRGKHQK
jgi:TPP-dependent 2-oxoacid decarboxylase